MTENGNTRLNIDGVALARKSMEIPKIKRFYKTVSVDETKDGFCILLDGRAAKTPGKTKIIVPSKVISDMAADEWNLQKDVVDPGTMPVTRLLNSALDSVQGNKAAVVDDIANYANADLLCYRAESPLELIDLQASHWDPVLDWVRDEFGAVFDVTSGVIHVEQPTNSLKIIRDLIDKMDVFSLSATASMTNLMGSVLLALAVHKDQMTPVSAWQAAHVDEDWQAKMWGGDSEASARRALRWLEMDAAARVATLDV